MYGSDLPVQARDAEKQLHGAIISIYRENLTPLSQIWFRLRQKCFKMFLFIYFFGVWFLSNSNRSAALIPSVSCLCRWSQTRQLFLNAVFSLWRRDEENVSLPRVLSHTRWVCSATHTWSSSLFYLSSLVLSFVLLLFISITPLHTRLL